MKKFSMMLVAFVTLGLSSCSSDDDSSSNTTASIVGKWEFLQEGEIVNGVETLAAYNHTTGCSKDYIEFKANAAFDDVFYNNTATGCVSENDPGTWTQNGTTITTTYTGGTPETGEILILTETTLKLKFVDNSEGVTETHVTVFKRI